MAIDLDVHGNTKPLEAAVQAAVNRIRRTPIKITIDDKGATQPLGNMKRGADEFTKSMEAANARILAFGASMAIINGVADAFKGMVRNMVEVEKAMADINVVMGLSTQNLDKFGDGLFKVAKEAGAAFNVAAQAATEYARQGLSVEESLKRTKDALILTRLTGMDSAEAVKALTAAMNTYGSQIKDTTQLVSKFAAVDVKFAVSAEDFAQAISRAGQSALSAGVDIDEFVGIVTAAQQKTARGGAVIGNSLKTIFTRIGRTDTLNQLENLGIAVRDIEGNVLGAKTILSDLANTFDTLSAAQKAQIAQTVGGVFQINILKAVLSDAAKQNGILAEASKISAAATDESIQKNEQLRNTMSAMATETGLAIKQVSAQIGEIMLAPGMEKILNTVKSLAEGIGGALGDGESAGGKFATGLLKGIGNVLTGPGLVMLTAVFFKLLGQAAKFTKESLTSLVGTTSEAQKQKAIQTSLVTLFGQNAALNKEMLRTDISRTEKEKIILGLLKAQVAEANALNVVGKQAASTLYRQGFGPNLTQGRRRAAGHIPNYADPERAQAARGGYAAGTIRSMNMPGEGPVIYNSAETVKNFAGFKQPAIMPPQSSKAGKNYQQAFGSIHGFDPYAAGGYIPNYAVDIYSKRTVLDKNRGYSERLTLQQAIQRKGVSSQQINQVWGAGASMSFSSQMKKQRKKEGQVSRSSAAMLVPPEGYMRPTASYAPRGKKSLSWPVYKLSFNKSKNQPNLEREVEGAVKNIGTKYSNAISQGLGNKDPISKGEFTNFLTQAKGSQGAIGAAVGSIFEAAANTALRYSAESSDEGGDFDVRGGSRLKELSKVFHGFPASMRLADYKNSDSQGNRISFYNKLIKEKNAAKGYIPNFADPLSDAIGREKAAGVPVSQIRVGSHGALMSKGNPLGLGVTNTHDEPNGLRDVFGANGFVPNYAVGDFLGGFRMGDADRDSLLQSRAEYKATIKEASANEKKLTEIKKQQTQALSRQKQGTSAYNRAQQRLTATSQDLNAAVKAQTIASRKYTATSRSTAMGAGVRQRFAGSGMMMTMGASMASGYLQSGGAEKGGAAYQAGGALQGAATGAMMASMVAPFLGPAAPFVVAAGALYGAFDGWNDAMEQNTKALENAELKRREGIVSSFVGTSPKFMQAFSKNIFDDMSQEGKQVMKMAAPEFTATKPEEYDERQLIDIGKKFIADLKIPFFSAMFGPSDKEIMQAADYREQQDQQSQFQKTQKYQVGAMKQALESMGDEKFLLPSYAKDEKGKIQKQDQPELQKSSDFLKNLEKVGFFEVEDTGDVKRIEELRSRLYQIYQERTAAEHDQNQGIILQLNIQKAMIESQKAAAQAQFEVKKGYLKRGNIIEQELKLMGGFISEEQKARMKYVQGLNKAGEAYELGKIGVEQGKREQLLNFVSNSKNLQQKLKTQLYKDQLSGDERSEFEGKTKEEQDKQAEKSITNIVQLNERLLALKLDVLEAKIESSGLDEGEKGVLDSIVAKGQLNLKNLENEKHLKEEKLKLDKETNVELGKRADKMRELIDEAKAFNDVDKFNESMNQYAERIRRAEYKMPINGRGIYRSKQQDIAFEKEQLEKRISLSNQTRISESRVKVGEMFKQLKLDPDKLSRQDLTPQKIRSRTIEMSEQAIEKLREKEKGASEKEKEAIAKTIEGHQEIVEGKSEVLNSIQKIIEREQQSNDLLDEKNNALRKELELKEKIDKYMRGESLPGDDRSAIRRGMSETAKQMRDEVQYLDYELGQNIPRNLASGLATAMQETLNGAKSLDEALQGAAMNFLQMIQQAMLQKAAMQVVGAMGFSRGGNVRNYSRGGGVPAMVTDGEYVMGRDAVNKYGGSFMHSLNAGGSIPGFSNGGNAPGSALAANFGGGRGYKSGRAHQRKSMSGFFYSQSGNVGLEADRESLLGELAAEERARQAALAKKAKKRALIKQLVGTVASIGIGMAAQGIFGGGGGGGDLFAAKPTGTGTVLKAPSAGWGSIAQGTDITSNIASGGVGFDPGAMDEIFNINSQLGPWKYPYFGGPINKYASGGHISGKSGIDQIPAMLSEGEYVIRASSARQIGKPTLDRINAGKFNEGGAVSEIQSSNENASNNTGNTNNINISINVSKDSKSEETSESGSNKDPQKDMKALSDRIKKQVLSVIVEEQRPGGVLQGTK
jgi:TP901 family phage tail tape measure protein